MTAQQLAQYFDHTLLKPTASEPEIRSLCQQAQEYSFASVCVNPFWVPLCAQLLQGSAVRVCTVVGFPLGANSSEIKAAEAALAVTQGASEIDMVINLGALKSGMWDLVAADVAAVVKASGAAIVKVILETCCLSDGEIVQACLICEKNGARFVKTSTGFSSGGATMEHVLLMKKTVSSAVKVKASGGIRTLADTLQMIQAGADRIGASAGVNILQEFSGGKNEGSPAGY